MLGVVLFKQEKYDEAIACYLRSLELRPEAVDVLTNLGVAYAVKQDFTNAQRRSAPRLRFDLFLSRLIATWGTPCAIKANLPKPHRYTNKRMGSSHTIAIFSETLAMA